METPTTEEIIALSVNSFDALADKLQKENVDLDARIQRLLPLLIKISDPKVLDLLEQTLDKSEDLEQVLKMSNEIPNLISTGVNSFDGLASKLQEDGVDIDERLTLTLPLLLQLSEPKSLKLFQRILSQSDNLNKVLDMGEELPNLISTGVNTIDSIANRFTEQGVDIDQRMENIVKIMDILTHDDIVIFLKFFHHHMARFLQLGEIFVDPKILNERLASLLEDLTQAIVQTTEPATSLPSAKGVFGLFKALKDRDVSKTLNFGLRFAKHFGQKLK